MNQGSFSQYKQQVYNPGSPHPNPRISPLKSLPIDQSSPYNSAIVNPKNPLKIVFCSKRKLSSDSETSPLSKPSPKKKFKMMSPEDVKLMTEGIMRQFREGQDESNKGLRDDIAIVNRKLDSLSDNQEKAAIAAQQDKEVTDARLKTLEDKFEEFQKNPQPPAAVMNNNAIEEAVRNYVDNSSCSDDTWKANLAKEVFDHEHGIVVHGVRFDCKDDNSKKESAKKFLKDELKASEDLVNRIRIKEVVRLGADNGAGKPPPILIKFGHPTERNQILPLSSNLKKGIDIDKNIPKKYQKTHREYKKLAWKLKTVHGVHAQVIFDEFNLILRYKKKDDGITKYNFVTEKEWYPKPGDIESSQTKGVARDPNKHDTPAIDTSRQAECHKTVIVTGVCETINQTNASMEFMTYFASKDHVHLVKVDYKSKGTVVITCNNWNGCKYIADTYEKTKFLGKDIIFTLFSDTDPTV